METTFYTNPEGQSTLILNDNNSLYYFWTTTTVYIGSEEVNVNFGDWEKIIQSGSSHFRHLNFAFRMLVISTLRKNDFFLGYAFRWFEI